MVSAKKAFGFLIFFLAVCGCATPRDVQILDERLYRLEQQNQQLVGVSQARDENEETLRMQSAEIRALIRQAYGEVQELRGRLEETDHLLRQSMHSDELRKTEVDAALGHLQGSLQLAVQRIDRLEEFLDLKSEPAPKETDTADGPPALEESKTALSQPPAASASQSLYDSAKAHFDQGQFPEAREQFQIFLSRYPDEDNSDNARFWIGETHYREGWYEKAILEYQKVIDNYPDGNKVPASLLKQGFAFYNIGDKDHARLILKELVAKYPESPEARLATEKLKVF